MNEITNPDGETYQSEKVYESRNLKKELHRFRSQDVALMEKALGELYDAKLSLAYAWELFLGKAGYPREAGFLPKIPARHSDIPINDYKRDCLDALKAWQDEIQGRTRGIAFDVCYRNISARACAYERMIDDKTVMKYLREALYAWDEKLHLAREGKLSE